MNAIHARSQLRYWPTRREPLILAQFPTPDPIDAVDRACTAGNDRQIDQLSQTHTLTKPERPLAASNHQAAGRRREIKSCHLCLDFTPSCNFRIAGSNSSPARDPDCDTPIETLVLKAGFSHKPRGRIDCTLPPSGPRRFARRSLKRHAQTHHPKAHDEHEGHPDTRRAGRGDSGGRVERRHTPLEREGSRCGVGSCAATQRTTPSTRAGAPTSPPCRPSGPATRSGSTSSPFPTARSRSAAPLTDGFSRRFPQRGCGRARPCGAIPRSPASSTVNSSLAS